MKHLNQHNNSLGSLQGKIQFKSTVLFRLQKRNIDNFLLKNLQIQSTVSHQMFFVWDFIAFFSLNIVKLAIVQIKFANLQNFRIKVSIQKCTQNTGSNYSKIQPLFFHKI